MGCKTLLDSNDHLGLSGRPRLQPAPYEQRERSYSASDRHRAGPTRTSSSSAVQYLSPDYGNASPRSSQGRTSTARRRVVRGGQGIGGGVTKDGVGATIKRSSSATLVADGGDGRRSASSSSFGSGLHLGSSVTFRNTFGQRPATQFSVPSAENHELFVDNSSGPRRSCSITLAYPSDSVILTTTDNPNGLSKQSTAARTPGRGLTVHQRSR